MPSLTIKRTCFYAVSIIMMIFMSYNSSVFAGEALLSWSPNAEPDVAGYKVYYGTAHGVYTEAITVGLTSSPSAPHYTVTNLTEGVTYYFTATSYDTSSNESGFSIEASKTIPVTAPNPDTTPPVDITDFKVVPGDGQLSLSWTNPSDPSYSGVRIRVRTDGTFPIGPEDGDLVGDFPGLSLESEIHVHDHLQNGTTYYYSAFSYDAGGNFSQTVYASASPVSPQSGEQGEQADKPGLSQIISGGCGMISPGTGKPPGPGQAADMVALLAVILIALTRKKARWFRPMAPTHPALK